MFVRACTTLGNAHTHIVTSTFLIPLRATYIPSFQLFVARQPLRGLLANSSHFDF